MSRGHEHCKHCGKPVRWYQFEEYDFIHAKCEEKHKESKAKSKIYKGNELLRNMSESCKTGTAKFNDLESIYDGYEAAMDLLKIHKCYRSQR